VASKVLNIADEIMAILTLKSQFWRKFQLLSSGK
jgi:hypothetical protein